MFYIYLGNDLMYEPSIEELAVFNPRVALEMGKAGSLEFDIPQSNPYYKSINQLTSLVTVRMDDDEIFRGRVLSNERTFNNVRSVYCEGDLAFLVDSVQRTEKYNGTTRALFNKLIAAHNARVEASKQFTVGNVTIEDRSIILTGQDDNINTGNIDYKQIAINSIVNDWNTTFDEIQTCLIDYVGGYLRTRYQNGVNYIDYVQEYGGESSQEIELGENLLDLTEEISAEELFTVLVPLGDDNITIKSVNGGSDELVDTNAVAKYGRIVKTHVFNNVNSASTLLENARRYLASNVNVPRTVTITAVDLHMLNKAIRPIRLGDRVHITSIPHDMNEYLTCTKIEYDLANPANNKYTFGNPKQSLTERYKEDKRKESDTYGNSASGGHGGGGAADAAEAAAETAETADEESKEELQYFYRTYIDLEAEDDGKISLGALLHDYRDKTRILEQDVGISFNASTGNVNIVSLKTTSDEHGNAIVQQRADFNTFQYETGVALQTTTQYINSTKEELNTSITQLSNDTSAAIVLETNRAKGAEASLSLRVDKNSSDITLNADNIEINANNIVTINGQLEAQNARIGTLEADWINTTNLGAKIAALDRINANAIFVHYMEADSLDASELTINETPVYHRDHYHSLSASSSGVVSMGAATYNSSQASFNMADTKFYKDGVSAAKTAGAESATLRSLSVGAAGSPYDSGGSLYADVSVTAVVNATKGDGSIYSDSTTLTKAVKMPFKATTVRVVGTTVTKFNSAGSASGRDQGSQINLDNVYVSWDGKTISGKFNPSGGAYYRGSTYSYNLRGGSGTYYEDGGNRTYYYIST